MRPFLLLILALSACDGGSDLCDDGFAPLTWYTDGDNDGYGDANDPGEATCTPARDQVSAAGDCDDTNDQIYPDAPEQCNGIDDNCDPSDDLDEGEVAFNGKVTDDIMGDLLRAGAVTTVTVCGRADLTGISVPDRVSSLTFNGAADGSSTLHTGPFTLPRRTRLTMRDLTFSGQYSMVTSEEEPASTPGITLENVEIASGGWIIQGSTTEEMTARNVSGSGELRLYSTQLDLSDVSVLTLRAIGSGSLTNSNVSSLSVGSSLTVKDSTARRVLEVFGGPLLENVDLTELNKLYIRPEGRVRFVNSPVSGAASVGFELDSETGGAIEGLDLTGPLTVQLNESGSVELRQPHLHDGDGIIVRGQGTFRITGGTIESQTGNLAGVLHTTDDVLVSKVIIRDTEIIGNGSSSAPSTPLFDIDDRDSLELDGVQVGTDADANIGPLIQFGSVQYDKTGEVTVTCEAGACTEG